METLDRSTRTSEPSVLKRLSTLPASSQILESPLQRDVDHLVSGFLEQATDVKTLAAITAGGMAYRWGRVGVMNLGSSLVLRPLSVVAGLGTEVTAFEFTHRAFHSISVRAGLKPAPTPHLWTWSGLGGWREGLLTSIVTFGTLKGFGKLAQGNNLVLQHTLQSSGMVMGHQLVFQAGVGPKPEGSFAEQILHAEAVNLQLGGGLHLVHAFAPRLSAYERGLDLTLQSAEARAVKIPGAPDFMSWATDGPSIRNLEGKTNEPFSSQPILMSSIGRIGGGRGPEVDPQVVAEVTEGLRLEILEEAQKRNALMNSLSPTAIPIPIRIHFDTMTGKLLKLEDIPNPPPPTWRQMGLTVHLQNGQIFLSPSLLERIQTTLKSGNPLTAPRHILQGILGIHGAFMGQVEALPPPRQTAQIMATRPPRIDETVPLNLGAKPVLPEEIRRVITGMRGVLVNLGRSVWRQTEEGYRNRPPLLHYINPPVLVGTLKLDANGGLLGSSLRRTQFSSDAREVSHHFSLVGTEVRVVLSDQGTLLFYHPLTPLNSRQNTIFENLVSLPENERGKKEFFEEHPHWMGMLQRQGMGKLLLKLNEALGSQAPLEDSTYSSWLMLVSREGEYRWLTPSELNGTQAPPDTLAILEAKINPLLWMTERRAPEFSFELNWGALPNEVRQMLEFVRDRVAKMSPTNRSKK